MNLKKLNLIVSTLIQKISIKEVPIPKVTYIQLHNYHNNALRKKN